MRVLSSMISSRVAAMASVRSACCASISASRSRTSDVLLGREGVAGAELVVAPTQEARGGHRTGWLGHRGGRIRARPVLDGRIEGSLQRGGQRLLVGRIAGGRRGGGTGQRLEAHRSKGSQLDEQVLARVVEPETRLHLGDLGRARPLVGAA